MIVLRKSEKTIILTGWCAWVFSIAPLVVSWVVLFAFVVAIICIGVSVGPGALLLLPAALLTIVVRAARGRTAS